MQNIQINQFTEKLFFKDGFFAYVIEVNCQVGSRIATIQIRRQHFIHWLESDSGFPFLFTPEAVQDLTAEEFLEQATPDEMTEALRQYILETDKLPFEITVNPVFAGITSAIETITHSYATQ